MRQSLFYFSLKSVHSLLCTCECEHYHYIDRGEFLRLTLLVPEIEVAVVVVSPEVERLVVDHERRISPGDLPQAHR